jgi:hypothetical protein
MKREEIERLLGEVKEGALSIDDACARLAALPF